MEEQSKQEEEKEDGREENVKITYTDPVTGKFLKNNPGGGRPKNSISLVAILKRKLAEVGPDGKRTYAETLVANIMQDALDLDFQSRKLVMQYIDGMPYQKTDLTITIPKPLDELPQNNSVSEDQKLIEENQGDPGRNSSLEDGFDTSLSDSKGSE